jgi:hypothetical protein
MVARRLGPTELVEKSEARADGLVGRAAHGRQGSPDQERADGDGRDDEQGDAAAKLLELIRLHGRLFLTSLLG